MLTETDLDEIRKIIKEETGHLPSREELASQLLDVMSELKTLRSEVSVVVGYKDTIENHEERIEKLEKHSSLQQAS